MDFKMFLAWLMIQPRSCINTIFIGGVLLGLAAGALFGWLALLGVFIALAVYKGLVLDKKTKEVD